MLWAITSYFNPMHYERRRTNYQLFRKSLKVPLVAVELAYGRNFELAETDADILVQLRGKDVMWQKERLLNLALSALPPTCRKVVWMDCDVIFDSEDWAERVSYLLDHSLLVQAFSDAHHLSPNWNSRDAQPATLFTQPSAVSTVSSGVEAAELFARPNERGPYSTSKGLAWAARREELTKTGLYDACIIGGGDLAMISAVYGCFDIAMRNMNERQKEHYLGWARRCHEMYCADISFLDGRLFHLWHGEVDRRYYRERHDGLRRFDFDPFKDIAHDENGSWCWNTDKPDMHDYVRNYFATRGEDR
ncbi:MAG TPA: hypothetical protein VFN63_16510 [Pseudolabrys sp.]|nr:hypothetical protein [Pseudolabrys sp.]